MGKTKRSVGKGSEGRIRLSVASVLSCAGFYPVFHPMPAEAGTQISLSGNASLYGNGAEFDFERLDGVVKSLGFAHKAGVEALKKNRFFVLCGECDRAVALIGALSELVAAGVSKILILTDTTAERERISDSLELLKNALNITVYTPGEYDDGARYELSASIYAYLTSSRPEVLVLGRDCITKKSNIIRSPRDNSRSTLCELIAKARPVVLTSCEKIDSGRTIGRAAGIFAPICSFTFCREVKNIHGCVIYKPERVKKQVKEEKTKPVAEQISMI